MFLFACRQYPDVIFLTVDTLRVDHVEAFALGSPSKTPNINALAKDSIVFTQAYSPISVTGPAFSTLHTGMEPSEHGVIINMFRGGVPLSDSTTTLAEVLLKQGYHTSAFLSGFTLNPTLNLHQGFENYDFPTDLGANRRRRSGTETTKSMLSWLQFTMGNVFVWWHTYDPHGPWDVWATDEELQSIEDSKTKKQVQEDNSRQKRQHEKRKKKRKWYQKRTKKPAFKKVPAKNPVLSAEEREHLKHIPKYQQLGTITDIELYQELYRRSVEHTDTEIGNILSFLKDKNRYDNSIIILTADHGESFTERELWFDHGTYPHEEQLHIPLIIKLPNQERAGEIATQLVGLRDIMPSVLGFLGFSIPKEVSGKNIFEKDTGWEKIWGESSHCKKEFVLPCTPIGPKGKILSLRTEKHRIIRNILKESIQFQVYDIIEDPKELSPLDIQKEHQPLISDLAQVYVQRKEQIESISWPSEEPKSEKSSKKQSEKPKQQDSEGDEELDMLRQLGYME